MYSDDYFDLSILLQYSTHVRYIWGTRCFLYLKWR